MRHPPGGEAGYRSYLLRLWPVRSAGVVVWRASLESTRTAEQHRFPTIERLITFLCSQTAPDLDVSWMLPGNAAGSVIHRAPCTWQFQVADAHSGEEHVFASLDALLAFLGDHAA